MADGGEKGNPEVRSPAVLSTPSRLLATSSGDKVTFFLRCGMVRGEVFLFINNISHHQIPKLTEGTPSATLGAMWREASLVTDSERNPSRFNWFCSGQNGGLSKPPVHFDQLTFENPKLMM